jgi:hypothetical protein
LIRLGPKQLEPAIVGEDVQVGSLHRTYIPLFESFIRQTGSVASDLISVAASAVVVHCSAMALMKIDRSECGSG